MGQISWERHVKLEDTHSLSTSPFHQELPQLFSTVEPTEKSHEDEPRRISRPVSPNPPLSPPSNPRAPLIPYSLFTKPQKRLIVFLIAFAGMFSPLSSFIYYVAITSLSQDLDVSIELINLTITSYMVVSGITPALISDLADMTGALGVYSDFGRFTAWRMWGWRCSGVGRRCWF